MAESFNIKSTTEWQAAIDSLEAAKDAMAEVGGSLKSIVLDSLTQNGISGDVANILMKAYEADVMKNINAFIEEVGTFIANNKAVLSSAEDAMATIDAAVDNMI